MAINQKLETVDPRTLEVLTNPSNATFVGYSGIKGAEKTYRIGFSTMTPLFGVVQTTGTSVLSVMSQKAVTDALAAKANISQVIDSSVSNSPSSYIIGLALAEKTDKKSFYNVSQGTNNFAFATGVAARTAVVSTLRAIGQTIGYKLASGEWVFEAFKGTVLSGTDWTSDANWKSIGGIDSKLLPDGTTTTISQAVGIDSLSLGTINNGLNVDSNIRLRTRYISIVKQPFTVTVREGHQIRVAYYDANFKFMLPDDATWYNSGYTSQNTRGASYVRLVIKRNNDAKMIVDDISLNITRSQNLVLTPTHDVSASMILDIDNVAPVETLQNIITPTFSQGYIDTSGAAVTSPTHIYSEKITINKLPFQILINNGFSFLSRYFNAAGTVVYSDSEWKTLGGSFSHTSAVSVVVNVKRVNNAAIVPTDHTGLKVNTGTLGSQKAKLSRSLVYDVRDYGISTFSSDNSPAVQALVNLVGDKGGGIIYFPIGEYNFRAFSGTSGNSDRAAIVPRSNVSFIGESITGTVFKMTAAGYYSLFNRQDETKENPLIGCTFANFTVDAYSMAPTGSYSTYGKAFYFQNIRNSIFRDLIIKGTPSTSVGIDFLVNVFMHNITVIEGGRLVDENRTGGSGIGIGTDYFDEENFIISDCITIGCGNYGIFIESQRPFRSSATANARGMLVNNCVCRDSKNSGMGIRTGRKVIINGCNVYNNKNNGVELKWKIDGVKLSNCIISDNIGAGVFIDTDTYRGYTSDIKRLDIDNNLIFNNTVGGVVIRGTNSPLQDVAVKNNSIYDNLISGIKIDHPTIGLTIKDNVTKRNVKGLIIASNNQQDTIIDGNVFMDGTTSTSSQFTGNTDYNDLI